MCECGRRTSCIGLVPEGRRLSIHAARPGDRILVSGTIGDHGIAIMSVREGIEFETALESDTASLADLTRVLLESCPSIRCMRDPTRGGLSSAVNELASASQVGVKLLESAVPLRREVRAACDVNVRSAPLPSRPLRMSWFGPRVTRRNCGPSARWTRQTKRRRGRRRSNPLRRPV